MWTRAMLKTNARAALKKNYVNVVIASLIFAFISGAFGSSSAGNRGVSSLNAGDLSRELIAFLTMLLGIIIILGIIWLLLTIFIFNPLKVGVQKFFIENHYTNPGLSTLFWAFKTNYSNTVKTMFLMQVYLILWSLLFAIPGIIKSYSYRLVPYILADNPDMNSDDAITLSREMMNGQKFEVFVLDLSFFLWWILSSITFNIVGILYVFPYIYATVADLYLAIKNGSVDDITNSFNNNPYNNNGDYYG